MVTIQIEAVVRGYHVYQSIWIVVVGESLTCLRERGNPEDSMLYLYIRLEIFVQRHDFLL